MSVRVPGSCGELAQGVIDGVRLHVSCPVDRYAWASWDPVGRPQSLPWKTRRALAAAGADHREFVGGVRLTSQLPVGIGMASSTADIAAAVGLYQAFSRRGSDPCVVARAALAIEPTDGVLFGGIVLFDHEHGRVLESWGDPPPLEVVAVQVGGPVDTVAFNARDLCKTARHHTRSTLAAFALIREGLAARSPSLIGHGATLSALCHQDVLPKPVLEPLLKLALQEGGYGVNVAHSGSLVGLLFSPERYDRERVFRRIAEMLPLPAPVRRLRVRGGGIETMRTV